MNAKTVDRHFRWMKEYGIDGAFVQRFGVEVRGATGLYHFNTVLANCRAGANHYGRAWAVMYDLSGLSNGQTQVVVDDWKMLVERMRVGRDENDKGYLKHNGQPVVAVWGIGFNDGRRYTLDECAKLIDFLASDPVYGGNTVMIGVPSYWRMLTRDCVHDDKVHEIVKAAHIVSPWSVGRFRTLEGVEKYANEVWQPDLAWCKANGVEYLPVVFPGFSWHNMKPRSRLGEIPRQGGKFLWKQFNALHKAGAAMVYQAMFDEVDEATAVFKCTNNPPVGNSKFLDYEGLPCDHYLWLVGQGRRLIRNEMPPSADLPPRGE
jgi:glycoprotein endo-alpha-1,2-mannosidase